MKSSFDYLIVGAGLTGAVIASELTKKGKKVIVVDSRDHIGGNCYTTEVESIFVHQYGAHIFHTNDKFIWDYVNSLGEFIPYVHQVKANYNNILYDLPFNLNTYQQIYQSSAEESLLQLNKDISKYNSLVPTNLEEQALKLVGDSIYNILIKGYTEKQWGRPCTELSPDIIKRLPLRVTADNNYFNDKYQGIPKFGYTSLFEKLLKNIPVKLNYKYSRTSDLKATTVIHTGMIDEYYDYCYGELEYRSLRFEHQYLPNTTFMQLPVINYTSSKIPFTRIIEHKNFLDKTTKDTIITKEYPDSYIKGKEAYYPINNDKNNQLYLKYKQLADQDGIIFCGRLGGYTYLDMDDSIREAFNLLQKLA